MAVIVLDGTLALDLAVAIQAFGQRPAVFQKIRAESQSPYEIELCGMPPVNCPTLGFSIGDLHPMTRVATADTVLVPGLEDPLAPQDPAALAAIAEAARNGARLVSLCGGAFVLGQAGVLDGHQATTHWALADEFRAAFPRVRLVERALYIDDGQVLTSGGMLAATDLCLHVLRRDFGQAYANDMSRLLVSPPHRSGGQSQYTKSPAMPPNGSLASVMAWITDHLGDPLTLESVAAEAHMSSRTLARRFRAETGDSVQDWIAMRRVELARGLLEDSAMTISQIAYAAGFGSTESLRRHFRAATGTSPRDYRQTFNAKADRAPLPMAARGSSVATRTLRNRRLANRSAAVCARPTVPHTTDLSRLSAACLHECGSARTAMSPMARISCGLSSTDCAFRFSCRWASDVVPGIGSACGDPWSCQASATC
jgi:transcriptional regulator GlxA family with amidase domain